MNLLMCIGEIGEAFIEEAELMAVIGNKKKLVRYGTAVAVASACVAVAVWIIKSKRAAA